MSTKRISSGWLHTIGKLLSWKMLVMAIFGFASGFPFYVVKDVLKAWMTDSGVDIKTIGLLSAVSLPYTLKFIWSPLLDRIIPPFLGRRRGWIFITQLLVALSIVCLGQFDPTNALNLIAITAIVVSFFGASQDIALDAFRREYLSDEEMGFGTGVWMNTWRLGMYVSVGVAFLAADNDVSYSVVHWFLGGVMLVSAFTVLFVKEPKMVGSAPKTLKETFFDPFAEFFKRRGALLVLLFILLYKLGDNMGGAMTIPFILKLGFSKTEYFVIVKGLGMIGLFGGVLLGGVLMAKLGIARCLWIFGFMQAISTAAFSLLVVLNNESSFWLEHRHTLLSAIVTFEFLATGMGQAAYASYMAIQTNTRFTATQYAVLSSLMAVPGTLAASLTGFFVEGFGWATFYIFCALCAVPGILLLLYVAPWGASNEDIGVSAKKAQ